MSDSPHQHSEGDLPVDARLTNADLAPATERHWRWTDYLFLWMSDVHSVAGYMTVGSFFTMGLPLADVFAALTAAVLIVLALCNLVSLPSFASGAPFPVVARIVFGVRGALVPALARGLIAVGWYGIQTWLASNAIVLFLLRFFPALTPWADPRLHAFAGLSALGWATFALVWSLQLAVFWRGMDAIRHFIDWSGPVIYLLMLALDAILLRRTGGHVDLSVFGAPVFGSGALTWGERLAGMGTVCALTVSYFSPIALNFGDFARYGRTMRDIRRGNLWGLPANFLGFCILALVTVALTRPVFGALMIDPVETVSRLDNATVVIAGLLTFVTATVGINISANFISAAFDFSNIAPSVLSWRRGGAIAAIGAVVILPWKLYARPELIHLTLDVLGTAIAPATSVLIADFYLVRRGRIDRRGLYSSDPRGPYWYDGGFNAAAVGALILGVACGLSVVFLPPLQAARNYAWFAGFLSAPAFYLLLKHSLPATEKGLEKQRKPAS